ncbi:MAG TPA: acetate kinase [Candidatus Caccovivens faecavium]|nr:acetate kinase [Candidatus Caccovivens faecavium]
MNILIVNAGSSSLKYQLLDMDKEKVIAKGNCEKIGLSDPVISYKHDGKEETFKGAKNHEEAIKKVLDILVDKKNGVIKSFDEINAIGHRVVMGGWIFKESTLIDDKVIEEIDKLSEMAPLHNPAHVLCMRACKKVMPNVPQVAIFDTAFHTTMPEKAYMYAIKYEDYEKYHIRRYGAHGTSHRYVVEELAKVLKKDVKDVNAITCHIGNGSSITAIKNGESVDTSMGLTPLQGVVMGTRSGDIDPTVVQFLCSHKKQTVDEVLNYLNKECGLLGVSGVSSDHRETTKAADGGNKRAKLALDLLAYSVKKYIGSYLAVLNGTDAIVFTGGIGENSKEAREQILENMETLGIVLDKEKNNNFKRGQVELISAKNSKIKVYVIPTDEELMMARDTKEIVKKLKKSK